jgi:hypothetical protein
MTFDAPPFVLISDNAIGDHQRAVEYDGCLKRFGDVHNECSSREYFAFCKGVGLEVDGQVNEHAAFLATILFAARRLDNLEVKMRQARPNDWYSPHLICRFSRVEEINTMVPPLREKLRQLQATGYLVNPGWEPTWIYAGHATNKRLRLETGAERDLSNDNPFMIAKANNGRATKNSKRILLMCEIGKRGLNNWPTLGVCNFVDDSSETDDIQFDFGRSCRWPQDRAKWHRDPNLRPYLTTMHFIPPVLYDKRQDELRKAVDQITGLRDYVKSKNLPTWESMLNGLVPGATEADFKPPGPLLPEEKVALANRLGARLRKIGTEGEPTDDDIEIIVRTLRGTDGAEPSPVKLAQGKEFVENLLKPEGKKSMRHILGLDAREKFAHEPITVVRQLKPKLLDQYTVDELERFLNDDQQYADEDLNERLQRLHDGDKITRKDIAKELQRIQTLTYHEPPKIWTLWQKDNGVIPEVANELMDHLVKIGALDYDRRNENGGVPRAVAGACKILFGVVSAGEHHEMDQHAYHIAIRERYRSDIKALARSILLRKGMLPDLEALALYHGEKIEEFDDEAD